MEQPFQQTLDKEKSDKQTIDDEKLDYLSEEHRTRVRDLLLNFPEMWD